MKKLMIAACAAMIGVVASAANYTWANGGITAYGETDYNDVFAGSIYLIDSAKSQADFVNAWLGGTSFDTLVSGAFNSQVSDGWAATSAANGTIDALGNVNFESTAYSAGTVKSFYQVAYDDVNEALYISELSTLTEGVSSVGENQLAYDNTAAAAGTTFDEAKSYQGAGWYTAATIPEPTSGLLLLLGMAGLALRRRRA